MFEVVGTYKKVQHIHEIEVFCTILELDKHDVVTLINMFLCLTLKSDYNL